jgi:thioredoxin reductase (NADPH)
VNSDEGRALLGRAGGTGKQLPVVVLFDGRVLVDPSNAELAHALGIKTRPEAVTYDVAVIGAGPAGLAAAMYGASEGLATAVLEHEALGGQAGTSSMIRNYLGFPRGVSGAELAQRAYEQAWILGADFIYGLSAIGLGTAGPDRVITLGDGAEATSRAVILATGVTWRRLGVSSLEALVGAGVFYGAAASEAPAVRGREVYVVGGANSAGQAAVHLARFARSVTILVRRPDLAETMSSYLIGEIEYNPRIAVRTCTAVVDGGGDGRLEWLGLRDVRTGATDRVPAYGLFLLLGAEPRCDWLPPEVARDQHGFVLTGRDVPRERWVDGLPPQSLATTVPGIFAAGDIRSGSLKRVASASGEGASVVPLVHAWLAPTPDPGTG